MNPTVKMSRPRAAIPARRAGGTGVREQWAGVGQELLAGRGQLGGPPVAHKQLDLQLGLQGSDLAGQHRLGDIELLGRSTKVQLLGHGDEVPDFAQIEVHC
jgi:hypothetical protein